MNTLDYPVGADNKNAPWNEDDNPLTDEEMDDLQEQEGESKFESEREEK
jgi:hypothetical protein